MYLLLCLHLVATSMKHKASFTEAYTPGTFGRPHLMPHDMMPVKMYLSSEVPLKGGLISENISFGFKAGRQCAKFVVHLAKISPKNKAQIDSCPIYLYVLDF